MERQFALVVGLLVWGCAHSPAPPKRHSGNLEVSSVEQLRRLSTYAVVDGNLGFFTEFFRSHGVEVLLNRGQRVRHGDMSLWLSGIDDTLNGEPDVERALRGRAPDEPTVLLSHNPVVFSDAAALGVDVVLSGHTHGGQIRLFGWAPITHSRYRDGLFLAADVTGLSLDRGAGLAHELGRLFEGLGDDVGEKEGGALGGKLQGSRSPDARGNASEKNDFVVETCHGGLLE